MTAVQSGKNRYARSLMIFNAGLTLSLRACRFIAALPKHLGHFDIRSLTPGTRLQTFICILIHFFFFLLHVLLLLAWRYKWLEKITFDLGEASTTASTIISVSLQVIATVNTSFPRLGSYLTLLYTLCSFLPF
jgi:TRAP-type mannitol/chloroaromatic compound transport system permease small subunit